MCRNQTLCAHCVADYAGWVCRNPTLGAHCVADYAGWVADALCLLTVSRGGLRQDEVLQLLRRMGYAGSLEVRVLHWLRFRLRVGGLLWETADGRIRFCHQHLHDITQYTLLS